MYLYYYWKILSNYKHFSKQNHVIQTNNISFFKNSLNFQRRMIITLHQTVGSQSRSRFGLLRVRQGLSPNIIILIEILTFQVLLQSYNQSQKSWGLGSPRKCLRKRDQGGLFEIVQRIPPRCEPKSSGHSTIPEDQIGFWSTSGWKVGKCCRLLLNWKRRHFFPGEIFSRVSGLESKTETNTRFWRLAEESSTSGKKSRIQKVQFDRWGILF